MFAMSILQRNNDQQGCLHPTNNITKQMKRLLIIITILYTSFSWGQGVPEKISYQAVIRNVKDQLISNQAIGLQINIIKGAIANGIIIYREVHAVSTNNNGMISVQIGTGSAVQGNFTAIDWSEDDYYIRTAVDLTGASNYTIISDNQLLSVPYALYAKNTQQVNNLTVETSVPKNAVFTDNQHISGTALNGTNLTIGIDNGNSETVDLSALQDGTGSDDQTAAEVALAAITNMEATTVQEAIEELQNNIDDVGLGSQGEQGPQGPTGPTGAQGPAGPAGAQGPAGTNGTNRNGIATATDNGNGTFTFIFDNGSTFTSSDLKGPQGAQGATGAQGPAGPAGVQGAQGPAGTNGTNGNGIATATDNGNGTFTFTFDNGSTFTSSDLTGPQGPAGTNGTDDDITEVSLNGSGVLTIKEGTTEKTVDLSSLEESVAITANADAITALETSKENTVNKSTNVITDATSDTKFPSVKAIKTYVDNKVGTITDDQTAAEVNLTTPIDIDKDGLNETNIEAAIVALADKLVPAGTIILSGAASAPSGYLLCDGSSVKRATYPKLFDAIGIAFGVGNLTLPGEESDQNFSLPDMRGRFARGVDGGAGNDPDRASRTTSNTGGNTGDNVGSLQADELKNHKHALNYPNNTNNEDQGFPQDGFDAVWATDRDNASGSDAVSNTGGNETRPKNVNLNYFIKY